MIKDIDAGMAKELMDNNSDSDDFVILDVRTRMENEMERIGEGKLIDISQPDFKDSVDELDKNKTYLVYCRTGSRSRFAINIMENLGFKNIYHLQDGIMDWIGNGYPTI